MSKIDEQHTELRWREKGWQERSEGGKGRRFRRCPPAPVGRGKWNTKSKSQRVRGPRSITLLLARLSQLGKSVVPFRDICSAEESTKINYQYALWKIRKIWLVNYIFFDFFSQCRNLKPNIKPFSSHFSFESDPRMFFKSKVGGE